MGITRELYSSPLSPEVITLRELQQLVVSVANEEKHKGWESTLNQLVEAAFNCGVYKAALIAAESGRDDEDPLESMMRLRIVDKTLKASGCHGLPPEDFDNLVEALDRA